MRGRRLLLGCVAICLLSFNLAFADASDDTDDFSNVGITSELHLDDKKPSIVITIDKNELLSQIPAMQQKGLLNPDLSQTYVNMHPYVMLSALSGYFYPLILKQLFDKHAGLKDISVTIFYQDADDFGHNQKNEALSFEMTRTTYSKINWEDFTNVNFPKILSHYKFSAWLNQHVSAEME